MVDYQAKKIPIFPNINDIPKAPDSLEGGNISHFYDLYNQLIDDLEEDIGNADDQASSASETANRLDASLYNYYYYYILPNRSYILFQNQTVSFDLGNHTLSTGETVIGTIPAQGEIFRIQAKGQLSNPANLSFQVGVVNIVIPKVVFYNNGAIWWVYDVSQLYADPYRSPGFIVEEGTEIKVISTTEETDINFLLEMAVYAFPPLPPQQQSLEEYVFSGLNTIDNQGTFEATIGIIPKTGKLQKIEISDIFDGYGTFFSINGGNTVLSYDAFETSPNGYQWTITDDDSQDVAQGQTLTMQTNAETLNFTIYLHIFG